MGLKLRRQRERKLGKGRSRDLGNWGLSRGVNEKWESGNNE